MRLTLFSCVHLLATVKGFSILPTTTKWWQDPALSDITATTRRNNNAIVVPLQMASGGNSDSGSGSGSGTSKHAPSVKDPKNIRNVAFVGHSHSGKTALVEWMLYDEHVITQKPSNGASSLDSDPIEAARHSSVFSHFVRVPHGQQQEHLLEVADTPWGDFPTDAMAALDGADSAVIVVSAPNGVQGGTLQAYQHCQHAGIKTMIALSKMDRPFLQIPDVLSDLETALGMTPIPLQVVDGLNFGGEGQGDIQLTSLFTFNEKDGTLSKNVAAADNDDDGAFEDAWTALEEAVAMTDDELLTDYLENGELDSHQVFQGLRSGVRRGKILPLVYTAAEMDVGVSELMDTIVGVLPNPVELRQDALEAACESDTGKCGLEPGIEVGFAARVLHTQVDSFGSLSVLRVISNSYDDTKNVFDSLPHEAVNLRTSEKVKMPSLTTSFGLCGKERLSLADGTQIIPGDVIAVLKLHESVCTNDILTVPVAVEEEEAEIIIETSTNVLTPLSRPMEVVPLMASATVSLPESGGGGGKKKGGGKAKGSGDDKLINALTSMAREDLALKVEHDSASGKLLVRCMSGDHMQLVATRLKDRYGLDVKLGRPPVQYRETLVKRVKNIEGKHKKQSGGSGQFGVCYIAMEPLEEGTGIEFKSQIKGGAISKPFISSVEKGAYEQLQSGGPMGFPVTDVRVTLTDGKMHSVDSKDIAFQSAGKQAVKAALAAGKTRLLQPMEKVTFLVDEKLQGEVNSIVSRQEGYVTTAHPVEQSDLAEIEAILPTAAIAEVSDVLRAESAGEGQFTTVFSHYQPVTDNALKGILDEESLEA